MKAVAHASNSSSTSITNRIEPSSTRIGLIDTIMRCADQNPFTLTIIQQQSRVTPSRDPATASFRNDQTLKRNSTPYKSVS